MKLKTYLLTLCAVAFGATQVSAQLPTDMVKLLPDNVVATGMQGSAGYSITSNPKLMVGTANKVFFTAKDDTNGEELWVSDGTVAGTKLVKDIYPGPTGSNPQWLCIVGKLCYFAATTPDAGTELWVSDGTAAGTKMVKNIYPGVRSSSPTTITAFGNKVLFFAMDEESEALPQMTADTPEQWLWISDGTDAGTVRIGDTPLVGNTDSRWGRIVVTWDNKKAFFSAWENVSKQTLWVTDGTAAGTVSIPTNPDGAANIQWLTAVGNKVVFRATTTHTITVAANPANASLGVNGDIGEEIWTSDGTKAGTKWCGVDFAKGAANNTPTSTQFAYTLPLNDHLVMFRADDGIHKVEPCILDLNKPFKDGENFASPAVPDLNPKMIYDINPWGMPTNAQPSWPQFWRGVYKGMVYFTANGTWSFSPDQYSAQSMWRCDVSSGDINQINVCSFLMNWTNPPMTLTGTINKADQSNGWQEANDKLWFAGSKDSNGTGDIELWMMPDNQTNPVVYYDFPGSGNPGNLITVQKALFFIAGDAGQGSMYPSLYRVGPVPTTGIPSVEVSNNKLNIYPNPATDVVTISGVGAIQTVTVMDIQGRKVLEQSGNAQTVNVSSLKGGLYLMSVKLADGSTLIQKLIVK